MLTLFPLKPDDFIKHFQQKTSAPSAPIIGWHLNCCFLHRDYFFICPLCTDLETFAMVKTTSTTANIQGHRLGTFWSAGHHGVLIGAFLFTEAAFMVWVLFGVLSVHIASDLGLSAVETGFMISTPILTGTLLRLPVGVLVDRFGARRVGLAVLTLIALILLSIWQPLTQSSSILGHAALLGLAGVSFSIAIPLVSHHYPPEYQGMALGLTSVGGAGTVVTALFAPRLAEAYGWQSVFGLAILPVALTMVAFLILTRTASEPQTEPRHWAHYLQALRYGDSLWFAFFYAVTFGGFIGLVSSLVLFFYSQFQMTPTEAGELTAACILGGAFFRPVGGWMADRFGGIRTLQISFSLVAAAMILLAVSKAMVYPTFAALFAAMSGLGTGNGALFQLIPLRFPRRMGVITGLVGTAGGLGGFLLIWSLGSLHQWTEEHTAGFLALAVLSAVALVGLWSVKRQWRTTWGAPNRTRGRV